MRDSAVAWLVIGFINLLIASLLFWGWVEKESPK
mgnify:CR=1 FL=1